MVSQGVNVLLSAAEKSEKDATFIVFLKVLRMLIFFFKEKIQNNLRIITRNSFSFRSNKLGTAF